MDPDPKREMLIKQLTWEVLNTSTSNAVVTVHTEDTHKQVTATTDLDPSHGLITALIASLNALLAGRQQREIVSAMPADKTCSGCDRPDT